MTTEDDFQKKLDADPEDWQTRLVFADWLQDRSDRRAAGYRAIAARRCRPLDGQHTGLKRTGWWWHCSPPGDKSGSYNDVTPDWFALLPPRYGDKTFWPVHTAKGGVRTRRQCEDALALAFAKLPPERQTELLTPAVPAPNPKRAKAKTKTAGKKATKKPATKKATSKRRPKR